MTLTVSPVRRVVVRLTVGSLAFAAFLGIIALVAPGRFGDTQARILTTTLVVGVTSVLILCYLTIGDTSLRWLGVAGGVAALVAAGCLLTILWAYWQEEPGLPLLRTFGTAAIVAVTLAQLSLLVAVGRRAGRSAYLLRATTVLAGVLAGLLVAVVLGWRPGDTAIRLIGVVAILDVLGTVVTIALGVFGGDRRQGPRPVTVVVPEPVAAQLRARAEEVGRDPVELAIEAVARYVRPAGS